MPATRPLLRNSGDEEENDNDEISNQDRFLIRNRRKLNLTKNVIHRCTRKISKVFLLLFFTIFLLLIIVMQVYNSANSRTMPLPDWGYNTSRNLSDYVFPYSETTIIEPRDLCLHNLFLLIVVGSSVNHFVERQTVRETWGNISEFNYTIFKKMHSHMKDKFLDVESEIVQLYSEYLNLPDITKHSIDISNHTIPIRVVFLMGKELHRNNETIARIKLESEQYDDIIQEDFIDTYNNLTIKSVMMLKWIQSKCLNRVKFVLKCDDDTFVNIPNLIHFLLGGTIPVYNDSVEFFDVHSANQLLKKSRMLITENLLIGYLFCHSQPVGDPNSKWYVPYYMYRKHLYPSYLSGSSYLMSYDVIGKLYTAALNTSLLHLEDVYLTGICANKIGLKRRHSSLFIFNNRENLCSYKGIVSQHYLKHEFMYKVYNFVVNTTKHCAPTDKYFLRRKTWELQHCRI